MDTSSSNDQNTQNASQSQVITQSQNNSNTSSLNQTSSQIQTSDSNQTSTLNSTINVSNNQNFSSQLNGTNNSTITTQNQSIQINNTAQQSNQTQVSNQTSNNQQSSNSNQTNNSSNQQNSQNNSQISTNPTQIASPPLINTINNCPGRQSKCLAGSNCTLYSDCVKGTCCGRVSYSDVMTDTDQGYSICAPTQGNFFYQYYNQGLYINGSTGNNSVFTYTCQIPPVNLDCPDYITKNDTFKICKNNNPQGLLECGPGNCCGNITDINTGQMLNCQICWTTAGYNLSKWFMNNNSGIIANTSIMYQCSQATTLQNMQASIIYIFLIFSFAKFFND